MWDLEVVIRSAHIRRLWLWEGRGGLMRKLVEVGEDWVGHKLRPEPQDRHTVRIELGNNVGFRSQETQMVLLDESMFVLLPHNRTKSCNREWAARTLVVHPMLEC